MPTLNPSNIKTPQQLRRLVALADTTPRQLAELTGLTESTINKYLNDSGNRQNYLFQFAVEHLAELNLKTLSKKKKLKTIRSQPNDK